jgi:hypothetical protein
MLDLTDFKMVIINTSKELRETMFEEVEEGMMVLSH